MIRQYAVPHDQIVQVTVPKEFNDKQVEVQIMLVEEPVEETKPKKKGGLGHLVGSLSHLSPEEKQRMDRELQEMRDSWERDI